MTWLEYLKAVIAARTLGRWELEPVSGGGMFINSKEANETVIGASDDAPFIADHDAEFIALLGSIADELLAVVDAAEIVVEEAHEETPGFCPLKDAYELLQAAIEREQKRE